MAAMGTGPRYRLSKLSARGTTNQTSLDDYANAITARTALVLKVHRSNFYMEGFVASPATADMTSSTG